MEIVLRATHNTPHERMSVPLRCLYYGIAVAGLVLTGHLGGLFVYGE